MEETTRKQRLFAGWVAIGFGVLVLIVMVRHPESFLVPAWVAYAAICRGGFGLFAALCLVYLFFLGRRFWYKRSLD